MRIAVVAPSNTLPAEVPRLIAPIAGARGHEVSFHPQCFLSEGHFAGSDAARIDALVEVANDAAFGAVWLARGGYGACRVAEAAIARMDRVARTKCYLGYSDAGFLLAGLMRARIGRVAHGPMPADIRRDGGGLAVARSLDWFADPAPGQAVAFNLTVLTSLLGTALEPDLCGRIVMIEEVDEPLYRIDRMMFALTAHTAMRAATGIMLGRCAPIPANDPVFAGDEVAIVEHWCAKHGIPYLGRADIGHDADNTVIPFPEQNEGLIRA